MKRFISLLITLALGSFAASLSQAQFFVVKDIASLGIESVANIEDATYDRSRVIVQGEDPGILLKVQKLNLSGKDIDFISFDFACEGRKPNVPVYAEIYWTGDGKYPATEADTVRLTVDDGRVSIPLSQAASFSVLQKVERIRIDIAAQDPKNPVPCTAFKLDNVKLQKVEIPAQPDEIKNAAEIAKLSSDRLRDLVSLQAGDNGEYKLTGENPNFQFKVEDLNLGSAAVNQVAFLFACRDATADPEIELYWSGDDMQNPTEETAIRKKVPASGWVAIDLRGVPGWDKIQKLKLVRIDIADPAPCKSVWLSDVTLRKQS